MSIESKIDELVAALTANTEIVQKQIAIQERLAAGAQAAMEKMESGKPATTGRGRKAKDTPPTSEEPAATESGADAADSASETPTPTPAPAAEKPKPTFADFCKKYLGEPTDEGGKEAYQQRGKTLMSVLANFGAGKIGELDAKHQKTAAWYIKRAKAGLPINFEAEYDFAGPVDQPEPGAAAAAAESDDEFGGAFDD